MREYYLLLAIAGMATLIAACGKATEDNKTEPGAAPLPTAATLGEQVVLDAGEYLAAAPYRDADRSNGERQAQICKACHSVDRDGPNMIGPALHGFFGTKAGSRSGFGYSEVMQSADFVWTPAALDAWLAQPGRFLPGNRMTFGGVLEQEDRDDLIAYLLTATTDSGE